MTREINLPLLKTDYNDQWSVAIANAMKEYATAAVLADRAAQQERKPEQESEPQSCRTDDGMPTERAVLEREWRAQKEALKAQKERNPAWHDAPTVAGIWHVKTSRNHIVEIRASEKTNGMAQTRWYGPIYEDV